MSRRRPAAAIAIQFAVAAIFLSLAPRASAQRLAWPEDVPKFRPAEYTLTVGLGLTNIWAEIAQPTARKPLWTGGILFDDQVRKLRLEGLDARERASVMSDIGLWTAQLQPLVLDPLPALFEGQVETVWQMEMINAEAFAVGGIFIRGLLRVVPRERPVVQDCRVDPNHDPRCNAGPNASFPSGHTGYAFMGAGLSCAHHLNLHLYGSDVADMTACVAGLTFATMNAVGRILDDRHWATDVIVGAALGLTAGWGLPVWLHYGQRTKKRANDVHVSLAPVASTDALGIGVAAWY